MNAQQAYMATQTGLETLNVRKGIVSDANLKRMIDVTIPYAATQGYGSLRIDMTTLLEGGREYLKQLGYRVKYYNGGEYGTPNYKIEWDRKSPKQNMWQSSLAPEDRFDALPN